MTSNSDMKQSKKCRFLQPAFFDILLFKERIGTQYESQKGNII